MRNKIPCTAERLGLLDPQMIQSVADANAFNVGRQYLTENRVRIVEADDSQITSAVIGNSGLYEQTIRLKDGHLLSKCSCNLPEEPMCRHCIAVLLEYHRWVQPRQSQKAKAAQTTNTSPKSTPASNGMAPAKQGATPDVKLSEVMLFVEWLTPAMDAIDKGAVIPEPPQLGPGEVATWIQTIRTLEDRRREGEEIRVNLESEKIDREAYVGRLTQQLQTTIAEATATQSTLQEVQREVAGYKEILAQVTNLVGEVARYDGLIRSAASEILSKSTQLNTLTGPFKELAQSLRSAVSKSPAK